MNVEKAAQAIHCARESRDPSGWDPDAGSDGEGGVPGEACVTPWEDLGPADQRDLIEQAQVAAAVFLGDVLEALRGIAVIERTFGREGI